MLPEKPSTPQEIPQGLPRREAISRGDSSKAFKKTDFFLKQFSFK